MLKGIQNKEWIQQAKEKAHIMSSTSTTELGFNFSRNSSVIVSCSGVITTMSFVPNGFKEFQELLEIADKCSTITLR